MVRQINAFPYGVKRSYTNLPNHSVEQRFTDQREESVTLKRLNEEPFRSVPASCREDTILAFHESTLFQDGTNLFARAALSNHG